MTNQLRLLLGPFVACLFSAASASVHADIVFFSDATFANSDWESEVFLHGNGGSSSAVQTQTGGNPMSYFQITNDINDAPTGDFSSVWAFYRRIGAEFDPSTQGAINFIDSSQDAIVFSTPSTILFQSIRVGLRQNGSVYAAGGVNPTSESWTSVLFEGLTQSDFALIDPVQGFPTDLGLNPDFSTSGSTIEFGFLRTNSTSFGGPGSTTIGGVDNWMLTVNHAVAVPEPSGLLLASLACVIPPLYRRNPSRRSRTLIQGSSA